MKPKQKFSDRFLPRKVSKQEIRARRLEAKAQSIYKIIMEDFTKFCAKHDKEYSFKECFMLFKTQNYDTVKLFHGDLGIRVLEVMEEQVNNAKEK